VTGSYGLLHGHLLAFAAYTLTFLHLHMARKSPHGYMTRFHPLALVVVGKMSISGVVLFRLSAVPYHVILTLSGFGSLLLELVTAVAEMSSLKKQDQVLQTMSVFRFTL
jgi:hypothetical protein